MRPVAPQFQLLKDFSDIPGFEDLYNNWLGHWLAEQELQAAHVAVRALDLSRLKGRLEYLEDLPQHDSWRQQRIRRVSRWRWR